MLDFWSIIWVSLWVNYKESAGQRLGLGSQASLFYQQGRRVITK
jgi:hypothetical protein